MRSTYIILVKDNKGKKSHIRGRLRKYDNIKMGLNEIGCDGVDWIQLDQDGSSSVKREHT
jgi:hypothetical protein